MPLRLIDATNVKEGNIIMIDKEPCIVKSIDISKTGKHGAAKARIEAINIFDGKKKIIAASGHERYEVPMIKKVRAQVLSLYGNKASIMDLETFETFDILIDESLKQDIKENDNVEYWDVEGCGKIIKRKL
ncbi:MAG: translation initiation factor IF-5A [Candidatus Pacearchaeota archaeon]